MSEPSKFVLRTTKKDLPSNSVRVEIDGQFTFPFVHQFKIHLNHLLSEGIDTIELDCTGLTYLDSPAVSAITNAHKNCLAVGTKMRIVNPRKLIRHIFVSAKLDGVLDIGPALETMG
jgi:anti-anti-sigma factor